MTHKYRINGQHKIRLRDFDPEDDGGLKREAAEEKIERLREELSKLQELLYAGSENSLLIILQGRDTSGKDGTIRHVMGSFNPQSCSVASFKVPTEMELAHDFLWRVHARAPSRGQITIFNRSHYEDVLVARVHHLVPQRVWRARYHHIDQFEHLLAEAGTIILKFYLHISKAEQEKRLLEREEDPTKSWKLSVNDWQERAYWGAYTKAYEDAINRCSTEGAPWFVVPANKKWYRNLVVASAVVDALEPFRKRWIERLEQIGRDERSKIRAFRSARQS